MIFKRRRKRDKMSYEIKGEVLTTMLQGSSIIKVVFILYIGKQGALKFGEIDLKMSKLVHIVQD